jgi:predicted Fe-Mo cluster-binding NifX family protein
MILACGSNDGKTFSKAHFGDMNAFWLFDVTEDDINFIKSIKNSVINADEVFHRQQKALDILSLLNDEQVDGLVNLAFGPNITVISKYVMPIITINDSILETLKRIQKNLRMFKKTHKKTYYKFNNEKDVNIYEIK